MNRTPALNATCGQMETKGNARQRDQIQKATMIECAHMKRNSAFKLDQSREKQSTTVTSGQSLHRDMHMGV